MHSFVAAARRDVQPQNVAASSFAAPRRCNPVPPPPPRLPPPAIRPLAVPGLMEGSHDLAEEIRRSLENLDAIIQQHDDGGLTEEEMLNLPAPAPELLDLGDSFPPNPSPFSSTERRAPPPAPARKSSIKQQASLESRSDNNGHAMSEEDVGIDNSSRSVADILQKFARANTPPKMPTVPPALRAKGAPQPAPPPAPAPAPPIPDVIDVPPPAAFRSPDPPAPEPEPKPSIDAHEPSPENEDFGFARLKKLAELSSTTGEDVHKQITQKAPLRRAVTIDPGCQRTAEPQVTSPVSPSSQIPPQFQDRRVSASAVPEANDTEDATEAFAFSRLRALAEQQAANARTADEDDSYGDSGDNELEIDYSQVPGYTRIDARLPNWKRNMVEKKNKEAIEAYLKAKEEEEKERRKWANVPAWKRNLVEKKMVKKDDTPSAQQPHQSETEVDDPKVPSWKRGLVQKRKSIDNPRH